MQEAGVGTCQCVTPTRRFPTRIGKSGRRTTGRCAYRHLFCRRRCSGICPRYCRKSCRWRTRIAKRTFCCLHRWGSSAAVCPARTSSTGADAMRPTSTLSDPPLRLPAKGVMNWAAKLAYPI